MIHCTGISKGAYFHGYYKSYCYLPLYCFCGNIPLWAQFRDCKRDASEGTIEALGKIVPAIRRRLAKKVRIVARADSGFARESIMSWCEQERLYYCFVLTNLPAEGFGDEDAQRFAPGPLYEQFYCARANMENRIKE